jgi:hypothetical protein
VFVWGMDVLNLDWIYVALNLVFLCI